MSMLFRIKSACSKKNGITLTELIVASVMIAIIMVGVASFSLAIKNLQQSTSKSVLVALRANSAVARIVKDASLAVGHESDRGVKDYAGGGNSASICFRHDLDETPDDYTDDSWICYYRRSGAFRPLESCGIVPSGNVPITSNSDCNAGSSRQIVLDLDNDAPIFAQVIPATGRFMYIDINLTTLYDSSAGSPFHEITNPRYTATTRVSPIGHSR